MAALPYQAASPPLVLFVQPVCCPSSAHNLLLFWWFSFPSCWFCFPWILSRPSWPSLCYRIVLSCVRDTFFSFLVDLLAWVCSFWLRLGPQIFSGPNSRCMQGDGTVRGNNKLMLRVMNCWLVEVSLEAMWCRELWAWPHRFKKKRAGHLGVCRISRDSHDPNPWFS